jgi:hypothetical protein
MFNLPSDELFNACSDFCIEEEAPEAVASSVFFVCKPLSLDSTDVNVV